MLRDAGALRDQEKVDKLRIKTSKKGTYLAVMAVTAVVFVLFLFIAPSFFRGGQQIPSFVYWLVLATLLSVGAGLWLWRARVKKKNPLDREEGVVSGQAPNVIKS